MTRAAFPRPLRLPPGLPSKAAPSELKHSPRLRPVTLSPAERFQTSELA